MSADIIAPSGARVEIPSMSDVPVIGVIACTREVEGEPAQIVKHRYLEAVSRYADALPLILPNIAALEPGAAQALMARLDAVLLTGSNSNIDPLRYGGSGPGAPPHDRTRDGAVAALIEAAMRTNTPVIGICRGLQEINVAFGGTLVDEREKSAPALAHHAPDGVALEEMFAHAHEVTIEPGSWLDNLVGSGDIRVNSVHFQRIDRLGEGLTVAARGPDGVVEALSDRGGAARIIAVQWHPEWRPQERAHDRAFWRYVGQLARQASRRR